MKKIFFVIILFSFSFLFSSDFDQEMPKVQLLLFLSEECEICFDVLNILIPELEEKYFLEINIYCEDEAHSKLLLSEIEKEFGKNDEFPIILIGNKLIRGDEVYTKLEEIINEYSHSGGCCVPLLYEIEQEISAVDSLTFPVHIAYIYRKNAAEFKNTNSSLKKLKDKYPLLEIKEFNIDSDEGKQMNNTLCKFYNLAEKDYNKTPKIFIGDDVLLDSQINYDSIKMLIIRNEEIENKLPWEKISKGK